MYLAYANSILSCFPTALARRFNDSKVMAVFSGQVNDPLGNGWFAFLWLFLS